MGSVQQWRNKHSQTCLYNLLHTILQHVSAFPKKPSSRNTKNVKKDYHTQHNKNVLKLHIIQSNKMHSIIFRYSILYRISDRYRISENNRVNFVGLNIV